MRIIVPIKQVPETKSVRMDEATGTVIREGIESIINPLDLYAIETAIQLKEKCGGETIALTMGPPSAIDALREAIAMGLDSALFITDKAIKGSDTWATAYVLAEAIKQIKDYDLIICGERATDGETGQVGPGIASHLDLPAITYVRKVEQISEDGCKVLRMVEDGSEKLTFSFPGLMTVVKEVCVPRLPTLRGKKRAKQIEIPVMGTVELNLDISKIGLTGSPTHVEKIFKPKVARECEKVFAKDEEGVAGAVDRLSAFLKQKEII
ncbi:MAG: electron transfer flavoprotein subunit beta/FixA family protein [Pseudomonadota bacterium]